jgi:hypothetical protein
MLKINFKKIKKNIISINFQKKKNNIYSINDHSHILKKAEPSLWEIIIMY